MFVRFFVSILLVSVFSLPGQAAAYRRVLVWLEGEPLAEVHARHQLPIPGFMQPLRLDSTAMVEHRARLRSHREAVHDRLRQLGFVKDAETDVVLHTLMGRMPEENIEAANAIPGVRQVRPVREYRRLLDAAVPLIGASAGWMVLGGEDKAGLGVKIGIIDTGIDINNPMLQDNRLAIPAGYPKGEKAFTNSKVIVARNYVAMQGDPTDTPTAMDRDGHGTFVAALAAGRRAIGPWAEITGVAPAAQLGNYRVTGSPLTASAGSPTDAAIIAAFNDAVADGMNVINLSYGGGPSDLPSDSPIDQAVAGAVKAGVVMAMAAGNDGAACGPPCYVTISSPGDSPEAVTAGASTNSRILANPATVTGATPVPDGLQRIPAVPYALQSTAAALGPATVYRPTGSNSTACRSLTSPADVKGKIVLVQRTGSCTRPQQIRNLATAGALAVFIYQDTDTNPPVPGFYHGDPDAGAPLDAVPPPLPAFVLWMKDGQALAAYTGVTNQAQATIAPGTQRFPYDADQMAAFSSRGPNTDMELKPDLVAPGTWVYSAYQTNDALGGFYSPAGFGEGDGTSFSAPITAGAAALVRQARPNWTPAQIKSALANSAAVVVNEGAQSAPILATGAGRLDVGRALAASAAFDPVGLSFGLWLMGDPVKHTRKLTITNLAAVAESFSISVKTRTEMPGASISVDVPQTQPVQPGGSATVQVTFQGPPSVKGRASTDGRLTIHANNSGTDYTVPYWGAVVDASQEDSLWMLRGNGQVGSVSTVLAKPLAVLVMDADWAGIAGVPVHFEIADGGGSLTATDVTSDFTGTALTWLRLPDAPGVVHVRARIPSNSSITPAMFTATARPAVSAPPSFTAAGVVDAASYRPALAPCGIFSIFGTGLAIGVEAASTLPLPQTLASAQVLFDGKPTALFYASAGQINAQVPCELVGATAAQVQVSVVGSVSARVTVALAPAAPGVFTVSQDGKGTAVVLHGLPPYAPVTTADPARPGEVVTLFATGLGAVQPFVPTGWPAPPQPLAMTANPISVTLGSVPARVLFSGLAPGFAGLYQVNFEVPAGTARGDAIALSVSVANTASNPVALPVR
jgi:uncharacterized protein (TIGR03437 family)